MLVYFIQSGEHVKIGLSDATNVYSRATAVRCHSPQGGELLGVVPGDQFDEKILHRRFAAHHYRAEWFWLATEIKEYIVANCTIPARVSKPERDRGGRVVVNSFQEPALRERLKALALRRRMEMQELLKEAYEDILEKYSEAAD